jgi:hypothetical protein
LTGREGRAYPRTPLTITDKTAEWSRGIPLFAKEKGKGSVSINRSKDPPTIELKVGDRVYKGIYRIDGG